MKKIFEDYEIEVSPEIISLLSKDITEIKIPNKTEKKLDYISKAELKEIHSDETVAKELILMILKNFSNTYILAQQSNTSEAIKNGYKVLNARILEQQVKYNYKISSPYKKIINLLIKYGVIEKGRSYSTGERSNEYRLTETYFGKGTMKYKLKTDFLKKKSIQIAEENLRKVLECPIATSELINRQYIQYPTEKEVTDFLKQEVKKGLYNKKGIKIVFAGKNPKRYEGQNVIFAEEYIAIYKQLVELIIIPIIESERGGNRVITAFNFMPSVLRPLCKFNEESVVEVDYSCLHPNICQFIYGGSNKEIITHDKVAQYLEVDRSVAKIGHLSFFNLPWKQMYDHKLFKYYYDNEPMMMKNIYELKEEKGYKSVSTDCFYFETELMRENIKDLREVGIKVLYCFDALYCNPNDYETVKKIMNKNAKKFGILTEV
jgi:hypothetical protein